MDCFLERLEQTCFSLAKTRIHLPAIRYMNSVFLICFTNSVFLCPAVDWFMCNIKKLRGRVRHERIPFLLCPTPFGFRELSKSWGRKRIRIKEIE